MKTAHVWVRDDLPAPLIFDLSRPRRLLVQREVGTGGVVVDEVGTKEPLEMAAIVNDNVIEAFSADRSDQALYVGILPRRAWGGEHFLHSEGCNPATESRSIDAVSVPQEIARGLGPGECFDDLLPSPLACRVFGDVEMDHLAPLKAQHDEHVQNLKRNSGDGE